MRLENWPELLDAVIKKYTSKPFEYGKADCVTFADECVRAITGRNAVFYPNGKDYSDKAGAYKLIGTHGGLVQGIGKLLHSSPCKPSLAQRGDVVMMRGAVGIMMTQHAWFMTAAGLDAAPRELCRIAWRVD